MDETFWDALIRCHFEFFMLSVDAKISLSHKQSRGLSEGVQEPKF